MTSELLVAGIGAFGLLVFGGLFMVRYRAAQAELRRQQEVLHALEGMGREERVTMETALKKAQQWKHGRNRLRRRRIERFDAGKYFAAAQNDAEVVQRLRGLDVDPQEIDIPPEIRELALAVDEDGILIPSNPTDGRNEQALRRHGAA